MCALLVPEYILAWAIRQRLMAGRMEKWHKGWTKTHGFFVIMGGFHLFRCPQPDADPLNPHEDDIPLHPLSINHLEDSEYGQFDFTVPTEAEIQDRGKSDWLAKTLVLFQTMWFVLQCIARGVECLPVTELEIVTLAYATMSFAIYLFWWNKPRNVECPIRVFLKSREDDAHGVVGNKVEAATTGDNAQSTRKGVLDWVWSRKCQWEVMKDQLRNVTRFIAGIQDNNVALHDEERVPTFWSGRPSDGIPGTADIITLAAGVIFGGIHCIAWSFSFPSYEESIIWHISCISMVTVPVLLSPWWVLGIRFGGDVAPTLMSSISYIALPLAALLYIIARVLRVVLAFTCLRSLPPEVYETVHWTTFIPHI